MEYLKGILGVGHSECDRKLTASVYITIIIVRWIQVPPLCNNTEGNRAESREYVPARQIEVDLDFAITV